MPSEFSATVTDFWGVPPAATGATDAYRVIVDPELRTDLLLTLLDVVDGPLVATLSPATAERLRVADGESVGRAELRSRLDDAGLELNGADLVSYLTLEARRSVAAPPPAPGTRALTAADVSEFARFSADAPEDDLDEAYVELDHWVALGTFVDGRLVAAASMYPWRDSTVADIGVITLPEHRGRGLGRRLVQAIAAEALARGHEPQYRHQAGNAASAALARSAGFARFAEWDVVTA
ncbi:putative acetyltransferase [Agromyces rhizosphaerae]|uniref:Acetyltransferase n=1 Tax=Agromyces rhizosphaerae TaxID=88374 RepID=A0A9W6CTM2_9MICO|nr:GNAT family N-acetyltransferase [Agromyces rhizosphaerae]GLI26170.1 putative acetyltransferase [Agromyces rhizosphaerae]